MERYSRDTIVVTTAEINELAANKALDPTAEYWVDRNKFAYAPDRETIKYLVEGGGSLPFAPGAPTIGTATAGTGTVTLPFTAPASVGASPILDYQALLVDGSTQTVSASPAVFTGKTNGTPYVGAVRARNSQGYGPYSAQSNQVTPAVALSALLAASALNPIGDLDVGVAGKDGLFFYVREIVGSGDLGTVVFSFNSRNLKFGAPGQAINTDAFTVGPMWAHYNGIAVQVTFSGATTRLLNPGSIDVKSDEIPASAFGVASIPRGAVMFAKGIVRMTAGNSLPLTRFRTPATDATNQIGYYASGTTAMNTAAGATMGQWQPSDYPGPAPTSATANFAFYMLGRYVSASPKVGYGLGDSIGAGLNDTAVVNTGALGLFGRAMTGNGSGLPISNINACVASLAYIAALDVLHTTYSKYCNFMVDEFGTNNFGATGADTSLATVQTYSQSAWTAMKAGNPTLQIVKTHLGHYTTSTDSWATEANQTVTGAGWSTGGNVPNYNTWMDSRVGNELVATVPMVSFTGTLPDVWKAPGYTIDGLHGTPVFYAAGALEIRAKVDALVV